MNKNTKKFVVTLLSVLMVLSFMPTMAFAAETPNVNGHHRYGSTNFSSLWYVDSDEEGLTTIIAPTCTEDGIGEITCDRELNDVVCGFKRTVWINNTGHSPHDQMNKVRVTAEQMMDKFGYTDTQKEAFYASPYEFCEANIYECANCGMYLTASGKEITDMYDADFSSSYKTKHTNPTDLKKCAASFTCTVCGIEGRTNTEYNATTSAAEHAKAENLDHFVKDYHMKDTTGDGVADQYVRVEYDVCKLCKTELNKTITPVGALMPAFAHTAGNWEVQTEPTCTDPGLKVKHCTVCGGLTGDQEQIDPLGHDYKSEYFTEEKVIDGKTVKLLYSEEVCQRCNYHKPDSKVYHGFADDPVDAKTTYKFRAVTDATCEQGTWIAQETYVDGVLARTTYADDYDVETAIAAGKIIEMNGKYYHAATKEEVPYVKAQGHDFGALQKVADATCTQRAIEAKVCSKCGKVDHNTEKTVDKALGHDVNEVIVPATCGAAGYSYKVCKRCNKYLNKAGDTAYDELTDSIKYDQTKPVVALGTECKYDTWKVIKEATADEDGSKILTCGTCGAELAGSETVIPADTDAKKDQEIEKATPVIAAAAAITADKYTADSAKAVEEAKAMLNQAISSGTAADVTRATAALQKAVDEAVEKSANPMVAKAKTVKAKANKKTTIKAKKAFTVKKAQGKVTYKKKSGNGKIKVASNGKVTVKKGLKAGKTYKVKVQIKAAGNDNYLAKTKTVTLKVKVK